MISHKDIMTGSLEMGRARNSLQWPSSTRAADRDAMRLTRCSDKNFLNAIAIRYMDRDYQ